MEPSQRKFHGVSPFARVSREQLQEQLNEMAIGKRAIDEAYENLQKESFQQQQQNQIRKTLIQRMERKLSSSIEEILNLREDKANLCNRVRESSERLATAETQTKTLREDKTNLRNLIRETSERLATAERQTEHLRSELEIWTGHLLDSRQAVVSTGLEIDHLKATNNDMGQTISAQTATITSLKEENSDLMKQKAHLEEMVTWFKKQHVVLKEANFDKEVSLVTTKSEAEPQVGRDRNQAVGLKSRMLALRPENAFLKETCAEQQKQISSIRSSIPKTLRSLLVMRYLDVMCYLASNGTERECGELFDSGIRTETESREPVETLYPLGLTQVGLDIVYSPEEFEQATDILHPGPILNVFYRKIRPRTCTLCAKLKIGGEFQGSPLYWIDEFPAKGSFFPCCNTKVCRECFVRHLIELVQCGWWHHLGSLRWLFCPVDGCGGALNVRCEADLQLCLERNRDAEVDEHVKMFGKALILRQALEDLNERPSAEALRYAAKLHEYLVKKNKMYSMFDPRFDPKAIDESGCLREFKPGAIIRASLDNISTKIPVFLKFFHRRNTAKDCIICVKSKYEIDYEDAETWQAMCDGLKGRWIWDVLVYPTRDIQQCEHDFDVCKNCTAEHLSSALKSEGPAACEKLSCPQCDRKLSYQEVTHLVNEKTVELYEKFLLQNTLSNEPNFRWCLSADCRSGQLYLRPPRNKRIECEECAFQMCFDCQVPWHTGFSCTQWQSQKVHGDPQFRETQDWLSQNTKACPGCSRSTVKAGGCFHMTCKYCHHQYCWECLADYNLVRERGQEGHNTGCYFRDNSASPMGLRGSTLEEALRND